MKKYLPLFVLFFISFLLAYSFFSLLGGNRYLLMHLLSGILFCQFSMLKLFDIKGFVAGYQKYDWLAKKSKIYAYCYPFIELFLGLGFLTFFFPQLIYSATIFFMIEGILSVGVSLSKGLDVKCACMGTALNVPISTVTLAEDFLMLLMAFVLLLL